MTSRGSVGAGPGATLLMRQVRYADAMRILLMDEPVSADEALRIGLVNEVVPHGELMARAEEVAARLAAMPPVAVRMMKEFAIRFRDVPTDAAWQVQHLMNSFVTATTTDVDEAREAFVSKREADFTGGLQTEGRAVPRPRTKRTEKTSTKYSTPRAYPDHDRRISGPRLHVTPASGAGQALTKPKDLGQGPIDH